MSFSWNKWRQYVIEEASVNEKIDGVGEVIPFFHDAMKMDLIRSVDYQRAVDAGGESEDLDAFESTQEFQQIGKEIIDAAVDTLEKRGMETHYLHQKFGQGASNPIEGADISNAIGILKKEETKVNPEADEIDPDDLDAAADYFDNLEEDKFDKPGWDLKAIMDSFKEDFEEATRDTDDIPYAQSRVIAAYKDVFAKSHPQLAGEIDAYLNKLDAETRKMFQNVADDPEVVGRDMMSEGPMVIDDFEIGDRVALNSAYQEAGGNERMIPSEFKFRVVGVREVPKGGGGTYQDVSVERMSDGERVSYDNAQLARIEDQEMFGELEGEVQSEGIPDVNTDFSVDTDFSAFDEAINEMALDRAMEIAGKLDAMQNDLEATLSQDEIDTLSDAIVLLRQK